MAFSDTLRRIQRANAGASSQYFADQNRRLQARASEPDESYLATVRHDDLVTQSPIRAIVRPGIAPLSEIDRITLSDHAPATTCAVTPEPVTGSPVNLTVQEITRMSPKDRAIAIRRVMAFDGAKARMAPVPGRTLTQALERELDHQRSVIRRASELARQGETGRVSKTQSKADRKNGRPPAKIGGTASFRGVKTTRVELVPEAEDGKIEVRRVSRKETGMLIINKARDIRSKK